MCRRKEPEKKHWQSKSGDKSRRSRSGNLRIIDADFTDLFKSSSTSFGDRVNFYTAKDFGAALGALGPCGLLTQPASKLVGQQAHFVAAALAKHGDELVHVLAADGQWWLVVGSDGFCVVHFVALHAWL